MGKDRHPLQYVSLGKWNFITQKQKKNYTFIFHAKCVMGVMENPEESNFQKKTEGSCYGLSNMNDVWGLNTVI